MKTLKNTLILFSLTCFVFFAHIISTQANQESPHLPELRESFSKALYDLTIEGSNKFLILDPLNPQRDEVYILLGKSYFQKESYEKALHSFEEILKMEGSGLKDDALYWSGESNFKMGRYDSAISYYQKLIDGYPLSSYIPYAYYSRGWSCYKKNELEASLRDFQKVADSFTDSKIFPSAIYKMTEAYYGLSRLEEAKEKIDFYIEKFPLATEAKDALFLKGEIMYQLGNYEEALSSYRYSLKLTGERAWDPYAYLGIAWSFFNMDKYSQAIDEFEVLLDKTYPADSKANALLGIGRCYGMEGKHEDAVKVYDRLINDFSLSQYIEGACFKKAESLYFLSRYEASAFLYKQLLDDFPVGRFTADASYNCALALLRLDNPLDAITYLEKAEKISTDVNFKANAICRIADTYSAMGNHKSAQKYYDEVLDKYPNSLYTDYAQYHLGLIFVSLGELDSAIITLNSLINNFPDSKLLDKSFFQLANIYYMQGHYKLALKEYYNIADKLKESDLAYMARYQIGIYLYNKGDYPRAVEIFENIINMAKDEDMQRLARYELGWCYYRMDKEDLAVRTFDDYIIRYPESDITADVIYWFAQYYYSKGSYGRVKISLERISEGFPGSGLEGEVNYLLGWTLHREGKTQEALKLFEYVITTYPDTDAAENSVISFGDVFVELGRYNDGIRVLNGVLRITESERLQRAANKKIGLMYQAESFYNIAITYYRKAITNESNDFNAELQFKIAQCLEDEARFEDAISEYLKVSYLYPNSRYWVIKARLRVAYILEFQTKWAEARKIYEEIALEDVEEAKHAQERLLWMDKHKDEL